jgi:hypothetical protein
MKRAIAVLLTLSALLVATAAFAVDFNMKTPLSGANEIQGLSAVLACDNGTAFNAFFQADGAGYGNYFNFGGGSQLSTLTFAHFGWNTLVGPYNYDVELFDRPSCTLIQTIPGLVAADAFAAPTTEVVDLCPNNIVLTGDVLVAIDANSCADPSDCYPDVLFDNQANIQCPVVVDLTTWICTDLSPQAGPFLLRVETDTCVPVPTRPTSWGAVKSIYR